MVYILKGWSSGNWAYELIGVFASKQRADDYARELGNECYEDYEIDEFIIDTRLP